MSDLPAGPLVRDSADDIAPIPQAPAPEAAPHAAVLKEPLPVVAGAPQGVLPKSLALPLPIQPRAQREPSPSRVRQALSLAGTMCLYLAAAVVALIAFAFVLASARP
jgi:hypothetical protein